MDYHAYSVLCDKYMRNHHKLNCKTCKKVVTEKGTMFIYINKKWVPFCFKCGDKYK